MFPHTLSLHVPPALLDNFTPETILHFKPSLLNTIPFLLLLNNLGSSKSFILFLMYQLASTCMCFSILSMDPDVHRLLPVLPRQSGGTSLYSLHPFSKDSQTFKHLVRLLPVTREGRVVVWSGQLKYKGTW